MLDEPMAVPWRVTDLKQYVYCPRILYYHTCLPRVRPTTYKMEASIEAHALEPDRERRRSLRAWVLPLLPRGRLLKSNPGTFDAAWMIS